jgi:hypothetical protein
LEMREFPFMREHAHERSHITHQKSRGCQQAADRIL